ncbi:MAG: hypothetical protein REI64_01540 [Pedobacter sp.]|uniref:hypothetical protein n=1 Tax=Pedobacter sp. TaxID=1411316 RepID=UPI00280904D7|nr:hypothetical protein [Pedobacter sp.]MDQ8003449.1 hypothetical protein [Pedobacter sp.]
MAKKEEKTDQKIKPRDGYDNTGTQGYDSLTDDAYTGSSDKPNQYPNEDQSRTGSSSEDFPGDLDEKKDTEE